MPGVNDLVFNPNAMGTPPQPMSAPRNSPSGGGFTQPQQPPMNPMWARVQMAVQAGLISPAMAQRLYDRMGYPQAQPSAPANNTQPSVVHEQQHQNIGQQIGGAAADVVGRVGQAAAKQFAPPDLDAMKMGRDPSAYPPSPQWGK